MGLIPLFRCQTHITPWRVCVHVLFFLSSGVARRSVRGADSRHSVQRQHDTLASGRDATAESWEVLIPGSFGGSVFRPAGTQAGPLRVRQEPRATRNILWSRHAAPAMMAQKTPTKIIKLALQAGKANPAPPVGPALGAAGVNIMAFCKEYNARTQDKAGQVIPVDITVYDDRSFTFVLKTPPASELLKEAAKIKKGSGTPGGRDYKKVGEVTMAQIEEIAKIKLPDLNTKKLESAMNTVMGTAKNMGITVTE